MQPTFDLSEDKESLIRHDNPYFIVDPDRIIQIIKAIAASPHLCTVTFDGHKQAFSTSLLDLNLDSGFLVLDTLSPTRGNDLLQQQNTCKLSTFLNGIHLAFRLRNINPIDHPVSPTYRALLPDRIYYPQRRTAPRIFTHSTDLKFRTVVTHNNISLIGTVFDLSRNGACINFHDMHEVIIEPSDKLKNCRLELDTEWSIDFDFSVRFVKTSRSNKTQIGGYFFNLSKQNQKKLDSFIAKLEREIIRNRRNLS
ncbi:MAG: hypothetical protein Kow0065_21840 [Methylomicrobium sp.]